METSSFKLKLKVAWFKENLGLAIDQISSDYNSLLTPYYFWPKTEAWEQLKLELDSKLWLTQVEKVEILKVTSNVMNYWLSFRNTRTVKDLQEEFQEIEILTIRK